MKRRRQSIALTIAGSDSGGGAGLQADLRVFEALQVHGTSATTCLTAQNPRRVIGILPVSRVFLRQQLEAVLQELRPQAAKTGMLFSAPLINEVVRFWSEVKDVPLVVDPVMIATSGATLLQTKAIRALTDRLFPLATLITPNLPEAQALTGMKIRDLEDLEEVAVVLQDRWGCSVLLKGGHLAHRSKATDLLVHAGKKLWLHSPYIRGVSTHGTGCTLSAAITAHLARGLELGVAVRQAKKFIAAAIRHSWQVGTHSVLNTSAARL